MHGGRFCYQTGLYRITSRTEFLSPKTDEGHGLRTGRPQCICQYIDPRRFTCLTN